MNSTYRQFDFLLCTSTNEKEFAEAVDLVTRRATEAATIDRTPDALALQGAALAALEGCREVMAQRLGHPVTEYDNNIVEVSEALNKVRQSLTPKRVQVWRRV